MLTFFIFTSYLKSITYVKGCNKKNISGQAPLMWAIRPEESWFINTSITRSQRNKYGPSGYGQGINGKSMGMQGEVNGDSLWDDFPSGEDDGEYDPPIGGDSLVLIW